MEVIHRQSENNLEGEKWVDDRVLCDGCGLFDFVADRLVMRADDLEKQRKVNHPALHWFFQEVRVSNGWARADYQRRDCKADGLYAMPEGVMHRCHAFRPKIDTGVNKGESAEGSSAWWQDEDGSSTQSRSSWWQE